MATMVEDGGLRAGLAPIEWRPTPTACGVVTTGSGALRLLADVVGCAAGSDLGKSRDRPLALNSSLTMTCWSPGCAPPAWAAAVWLY